MSRKHPEATSDKPAAARSKAEGRVNASVENALSHGDAAARKLAAVLAHTLKTRGGSLRRLQKGALEAVRSNLEAGNWDGLVKLPTGAGKTRLFCEISGALGLPTLVLVPRKSLVEQTGEAYRALQKDGAVDAGARITEISSGDGGTAAGKVTDLLEDWGRGEKVARQEIVVTTYQSLTSLAATDPDAFADLFVRMEAVVSDEAHRSLGRKTRAAVGAGLEQNGHVTWSVLTDELRETIREEMELDEDETLEGEDLRAALRLLADVQNATEELAKMERAQGRKLHLLFTATPDLIDKSAEGVSPYVYRATLADAAQDGDVVLPSLADVGHAHVTLGEGEEIGPKGVRNRDLDGWIDRFEVEAKDGTKTPVAVAVTEKYLELRKACGGRLPAVALCRTIEHAGRIVELLRSKGIRAERVTSDRGDIKEKAAKARLQDGTLEAVVTVTKVSEGWDVPELSAALWYAPTLSPAKNLQANGRIMRAKEGKTRENVFIVEPTSWDVTREYEGPTEPGGDEGPGPEGPRTPPTDDPKGPRVTNLPNSVQRMVEMGELTEEQAAGLYPGVKIEHLPEATEEKDWLVDILWPDGKTEPGRAMSQIMPDVHGVRGETVLRRLEAWRFGTDAQKAWLAGNVKDPGARGGNGSPVTVVRASALEKFCQEELGGGLPVVTENGCWLVKEITWPDGKTEPGRALRKAMPDVYGAKCKTILNRLEAWRYGTDAQKEWLAGNVKDPGAKTDAGRPIVVVRASALKDFIDGKLRCSDPCKTNGWTTLLDWPDGKTEQGRAVKNRMPDIHGVRGETILARLEAWQSGTAEQKKWLAVNVRDPGAKTDSGKPVTVVRASALEKFCQEELGGGLPVVTENGCWLVKEITWPDGKTEPGRAVTKRMSDIHGARGQIVIRRLKAWKSGTDEQREWYAANVKEEGVRGEGGKPVTVVRAPALERLCHDHCAGSLPVVKSGGTADVLWPDGKTEPGRAVTRAMPDVHGAKGFTVVNRLEAWRSGTDAQKEWLAENVKFGGARGKAGRPVAVVRASALGWFVEQIRR